MVHVGYACSNDGVGLVGAYRDGAPERFGHVGHVATPWLHLVAHGGKSLFGHAEYPFGPFGTHREEGHVGGHIQRLEVTHAIFAGELLQVFFASQDVVSQFATSQQQVLKIVIYRIAGRVAVAGRFLEHHVALAVQFLAGENRPLHEVGQQVDGAGQMLMGEHRVEHRAFLGGIGIELSADTLHAVEDVPGAAMSGSLEDGVFDEVSQAKLALALVTAARVDGQAAPGCLGGGADVDHAQAVGQGMIVDVH